MSFFATATAARHAPTGALRLAHRLEAAARRRRGGRRWLAAALAVPACLAIALLAARGRESLLSLLALLDAHRLIAGGACALLAGSAVRHGRRERERRHAESWLAAAPIGRGEVVAWLRERLAVRLLPVVLVPLALIAAVGSAGGRAPGGLLATLAGAIAVGAVGGWRAGARERAFVPAALPRLRARRRAAPAVGFAALRRWPFAQAFADLRPREHVRVVAALLLGLPAGMPATVVLALLLLLAAGFLAAGLLRATAATIPAAADLLRSAPLPLARLAADLCLRVCVCELALAAGAAALAWRLGAPAGAALGAAAAWLAWVAVALLQALALRHQPERLRPAFVASGLALVALAAAAWPLLAIVLPAFAAWSWRRAAAA